MSRYSITSLLLAVFCVTTSPAWAYQPGSGDVFTADFDSGVISPFLDYPVPAIGFGRFIVLPSEQAAWANGFYGRIGGTGSPGYGQSITYSPLSHPRDYSAALRVQPDVPPGVSYLFYVTLRAQSLSGEGWQYNIDETGKMFVRRYNGMGNFGPNIVESATGVISLASPANQYIRCEITGAIGSVRVRMKQWQGTAQSEPSTWDLDGLDTNPANLGGTSTGIFVNVLYIPPLTSDPNSTSTAGTRFDDFDLFDETSSGVKGWRSYE